MKGGGERPHLLSSAKTKFIIFLPTLRLWKSPKIGRHDECHFRRHSVSSDCFQNCPGDSLEASGFGSAWEGDTHRLEGGEQLYISTVCIKTTSLFSVKNLSIQKDVGPWRRAPKRYSYRWKEDFL